MPSCNADSCCSCRGRHCLGVECAVVPKNGFGFLANTAPQNSAGPEFQMITGVSSAPAFPSSAASKNSAVSGTPSSTRPQSSSKARQVSSQPPAERSVKKSCFSDALFVGDSLTEGLKLYGGLDDASYFSRVGLSIYQLFEQPKQTAPRGLHWSRPCGNGSMGKFIFSSESMNLARAPRRISSSIILLRWRKSERCSQTLQFISSLFSMSPRKRWQDDPVFSNNTIRTRNNGLKTLADGSHIFMLMWLPLRKTATAICRMIIPATGFI